MGSKFGKCKLRRLTVYPFHEELISLKTEDIVRWFQHFTYFGNIKENIIESKLDGKTLALFNRDAITSLGVDSEGWKRMHFDLQFHELSMRGYQSMIQVNRS